MIVSVTDGDSIGIETDAGSFQLRLYGINAPEAEECQGDEARRWMIANARGADIALQDVGIDQFGRTLALVWIGDRLLNLTLVEIGLAIALGDVEDDRIRERLLSAEKVAVAAGVGMWSPEACGTGPLPPIAITSIDADPPGPDGAALEHEVVTITNIGDTAVEISGWTLRDESSANRYRFPPETLLDPGAEIKVDSGETGFASGSPVWNNEGDMAILVDANGRFVSRLRY